MSEGKQAAAAGDGGTAAHWEPQYELGHYPGQVQSIIRNGMPKTPHLPDATTANAHKTHASNENTLKGLR